MTLPRTIRRYAALAALLGVVLQAFWPLIAQARPGSSSWLLTSICSVGGNVRSVELPGIPPADHNPAKQVKHCPLCSGSDRAQAIVAAAVPVLAVPAGVVDVQAPPALPSFRTTVVSPAHPRAPPVQS